MENNNNINILYTLLRHWAQKGRDEPNDDFFVLRRRPDFGSFQFPGTASPKPLSVLRSRCRRRLV